GTYCNEISLNGGTLTLNPGVYILQGGIDIGAQANLVNNTTGGDGSGGVMLYVTGTSSGVNAHGQGDITLNAPTTGTYKGIVMWQDKNDTTAATLKGGSTELLNGVLYFPKAALSFNGGTSGTATNTTI